MDHRQNLILKEIVESYIKDVKPVSSKSLCNKFKCSSATIRNEMVMLEKLGLIEKHHISSGRIPSEAGYKYYVNNLMVPEELTGKDVLKLQTIFSNNDLVISDAINKSMEIISEITNYTSIVLGKSSKENLLQKVDIIKIDNHKIIALVATNKGVVQNKTFSITGDTSVEEIIRVSEIINKMLIGTPIDKVSERLEFEIKPIIIKEIEQHEAIYSMFYKAFDDFVKERSKVLVQGKTKMLNHPEYQDVSKVKKLTTKFEDLDSLEKLRSDLEENDIKIYIGEDTKFDSGVSVIKKSYNIEGEEGTIAIVGPKRMDYSKIMGILNYIEELLEKRKEE